MRAGPPRSARRLLVFDFDGTVAVGDAPVQAYLSAVVDRYGRGAVPLSDVGRPGSEVDGYAAVARWAAASGVPESVRRTAYAASRAALHEGRIPVEAPEGLADLLDRRPAGTACVLVTNAPVVGIEPLIERLGLSGRFDGMIGDARKPDGLRPILERLLDRSHLPAERLLAVGDVWPNDLEPAAALGAATAHVDRFVRGDGAPTFRARTLPELYDDVERWWGR